MAEMFHRGSRELQDRFDTRRLADRIEEKLVSDAIMSERRRREGASTWRI